MPEVSLLKWEILSVNKHGNQNFKMVLLQTVMDNIKRTLKVNLSKGCEPSSTKSMKFVSKTCPV